MQRLLILMALLAFAGVGRADSAGTYGDVTVTTDLSPSHNQLTVTLSTRADDGTTVTNGPVNVTADPNGGSHDVLNSPEIRLDGETYRWSGGRFQKKQADGSWKTIPKKKPKKNGQRGMDRLVAGQPAPHDGILQPDNGMPSMPLQQGDLAPYDGYFGPGDEVTSLPFPGGGG